MAATANGNLVATTRTSNARDVAAGGGAEQIEIAHFETGDRLIECQIEARGRGVTFGNRRREGCDHRRNCVAKNR